MTQTHPSGIHHVGVPVASIERSLAFYRELFGIEPDFVADASGSEVSEAVGVPEAEFSYAFLRIGDHVLELLGYRNPRGNPYDRRSCDVGAVHIAFEVPDIDESYERLRAKGVSFNAPPLRIPEGPLEGCAFAYFTDPDGIQLEIFQTAAARSS